MKEKALKFAKIKHKNQMRKGNDPVPYIEHPICVAIFLKKYLKNDDETLLAVAYLHDTLENTNTTYEELLINFNKKIADLVQELTNDKEQINQIGKAPYLALKMNNMSEEALTVKLCDRLSNIIDCIKAEKSFRIKYTKETIFILTFILKNRNLKKIHLQIINDLVNQINKLITKDNNFLYEEKNNIYKIKKLVSIQISN